MTEPAMREFDTGATRNVDTTQLDFEGFLSPAVLMSYGRYMHKNRLQADGKLRDADNWQKGIPTTAYMKSLMRHFMDVWAIHRGEPARCANMEEALNGLLFNVMGYQFETLKLARTTPTNAGAIVENQAVVAPDATTVLPPTPSAPVGMPELAAPGAILPATQRAPA